MKRSLAVLLAVASVAAASTGARADHGGPHPDSTARPLLDGCRRSTGEILVGTAPEWVYVDNDRTPRTLEGTVEASEPSGEDNPFAHDSYDWNAEVTPDPGYEGLAATANVADEDGAIGVEWEQAAIPFWAWPKPEDHVSVIGSWIWDCGHWGNSQDPREDPRAWIPYAESEGVRGEETEIHPPRAVFTLRKEAADSSGEVQRADLWISSDGTPAREQEECGASVGADPSRRAVAPEHLALRATGVAGGCSSWQPVNDRDYDFTIPAPPGTGAVSYDVLRLDRTSAPLPQIAVVGDEVRVHVPFAGYGEPAASLARAPMSLGLTVVARRASAPSSVGVRVRLDSLTVNTELDTEAFGGDAETMPPDEYAIYTDVAGSWTGLNDVAPSLTSARPGDTFTLGVVSDVWLPADGELRVRAFGRECDLPRMAPCPAAEFGFNEGAGTLDYATTDFLSEPVGATRTVTITSSGGTDGCGCYTLTFTLERI